MNYVMKEVCLKMSKNWKNSTKQNQYKDDSFLGDLSFLLFIWLCIGFILISIQRKAVK